MKKMIALLLAAMMVLSMAACASKTAAAADSDLAYIQDKGTLVIGITDFEPMDYKDADGSWIGFDADINPDQLRARVYFQIRYLGV